MRRVLLHILSYTLFLICLSIPVRVKADGFLCAGTHWPQPVSGGLAVSAKPTAQQTNAGFRSAVAIFSRFHGEAQTAVPDWAHRIFDPELPGSFSHFYDTMSFGALQVRGDVIDRQYESDHEASRFVVSPGEPGLFGDFATEILRKADQDVDFAVYDNDGPDGVPNSGDDDGTVDAVFLVVGNVPENFILSSATGVSDLGFESPYVTDDKGVGDRPIIIDPSQGTLQEGNSYSVTVGSMCHEYGHVLGLPDLFDTEFLQSEEPLGPEQDSAGIGKWGLMGWGALGWQGDDGPASFGAWSREQLGWVQVIELDEDQDGIRLASAGHAGTVYRLPVRKQRVLREYYLLESRQRQAYYDRNIPGEGLLIWHVYHAPSLEGRASKRVVDVECADGRWRAAGYPLGDLADAHAGSDNLDFWSHDREYAEQHGGNLGDSTDPFDGKRFTMFAPSTNPSSLSTDGRNSVVVRVNANDEGTQLMDVQVAAPVLEVAHAAVRTELQEGSVLAGDEVPVGFTLRNFGGSMATDLSARLTTTDDHVEILKGESPLPDLAAGQSHSSVPVSFRVRHGDEAIEAVVVLEIHGMGRTLNSQELRVTAHMANVISGSVRGETGEAVPGAVVRVYNGDTGVRKTVTTGADGQYEFVVQPGTYRIWADDPAPVPQWGSSDQHVIVVDKDVEHNLELPGLFTLSGTVTGPDGARVGGMHVSATERSGIGFGIRFRGESVETDDRGSFNMQLPRGVYRIATQHEPLGFPPMEAGTVDLKGDTEFDITVERGVTVTVYVVSEAGDSVSGVTVSLEGFGLGSRSETQSNGSAEFAVFPGWYTVTVPQPIHGVEPAPVLIEVASDTTLQVHLTDGPLVTGSVVRRDGSRVRHGSVSFYAEREGKERSTRVAEGSYSLVVAPGEYGVAIHDGVSQPQGHVTIQADTTLEFVVDSHVAISGGITGRTATEIDGSRITFASLEGKGSGPGTLVSGGRFTLDTAPGWYRVSLYTEDGAARVLDERLKVDDSEVEHSFHMETDHAVTGHLAASVARRYTFASVTFTAVDGSYRASRAFQSDGVFDVRLQKGDYRVELLAANDDEQTTTWLLGQVTVPHMGPLELSPPQGSAIFGRVTGLGPADRVVIWLMKSPHRLGLNGLDEYVASTTSDGFYRLEVAPGTYDVAYSTFDGQIGQVIEGVGLNGAVEQSLRMPDPGSGHRLWGQVLDAEETPASFARLQFYSEQHNTLVVSFANSWGMYAVDLPLGIHSVAANQGSGISAVSLGIIDFTNEGRHDLRPSSATVVEDEFAEARPRRTELGQNYPNPFNGVTSVRLFLDQEGEATLTVYNLLGQKVKTLVDARIDAGARVVIWGGRDDDGRAVATGVYVYRLQFDDQILTRKLLLLQ